MQETRRRSFRPRSPRRIDSRRRETTLDLRLHRWIWEQEVQREILYNVNDFFFFTRKLGLQYTIQYLSRIGPSKENNLITFSALQRILRKILLAVDVLNETFEEIVNVYITNKFMLRISLYIGNRVIEVIWFLGQSQCGAFKSF